jgi:hypothetical protein
MEVTPMTKLLLITVTAAAAAVAQVTPQQYGALGNGIHDDTTAIQTALNVAGKGPVGRVYIPGGQYKVTALQVPRGVTIEGDGFADGNTSQNMTRIFTVMPNVTVFTFADSLPDIGAAYDTVIRNVYIDCNNHPNTIGVMVGSAIQNQWTYYQNFENIAVSRCGTNILVRNAFNLRFVNVRSYGSLGHGLYLNPVNYTTTIKIEDGDYSNNGKSGIVLAGPYNADVTIRDSIIEGNTQTDLLVAAPAVHLTVDGAHFEQAVAGRTAMDLSGYVPGNSGITPGPISISRCVFGNYSTAVYSSAFVSALSFRDNYSSSYIAGGLFLHIAGATQLIRENNIADKPSIVNGVISQ